MGKRVAMFKPDARAILDSPKTQRVASLQK
jgi:hypothetical protein